MLPVVWKRAATDELQHALAWYAAQSKAAAERFSSAVEDVVRDIARSPYRFAEVRFACRRANVPRFPYGIIYGVEIVRGKERVLVLACFHGKRNPQQWHTRIT